MGQYGEGRNYGNVFHFVGGCREPSGGLYDCFGWLSDFYVGGFEIHAIHVW
jgi:hypothetical protein